MKKSLKYLSLIIVFFVPLMIFAGTSLNFGEENASENSEITSPIKAKNVKIHPKRSLPSPAHLGEMKSPPDHSNAGGNNSDDGDEDGSDSEDGGTNETFGEEGVTGVLGSKGIGEKYAIVIGIADYPGEDLDLKYTDDDADEVVWNLINVYGYNEDNIVTLIDRVGEEPVNATYENIENEVNNLKDVVDENDEVVFFFSGHGGSGEIEGETHQSIWVHTGTNTVPLWDVVLKGWFSDISTTTRVVFGFDSCLSGGMNDLAGEGRIVVTASTETGTAYEFDNLENGQFTYYFFQEGMRGGLADTYNHENRDEEVLGADVVIEEAYEYTKNNYSPRYKRQGPAIFDGFKNDLLLGY